jgi:hypothetical protein
MNPDQIPDLIKTISLADSRIMPTDPDELIGMAALWATVLADVPEQFARDTVGRHYAHSPYPIKPADIAACWRTAVRARMASHAELPPDADPDDELAYRRALRDGRAAVATGAQPPRTVRELTAGTPAAIEQATAGIGRPVPAQRTSPYVPDDVRAELTAAVPGFGRRYADHPELAICCPRPQCRALERRPCRTPSGRPLSESHDSRRRAWISSVAACPTCQAGIDADCRQPDGRPLIETVHPERLAEAQNAARRPA